MYSWNETLPVSDSYSVHHQEFFHCTHSNAICHKGLLTACEQDQDGNQFHHDCCMYSKKMKLVSPLHEETSVTWICLSHGLPMFLSVAEKLTSFFVIVKK
jgi:hypothetical protein